MAAVFRFRDCDLEQTVGLGENFLAVGHISTRNRPGCDEALELHQQDVVF